MIGNANGSSALTVDNVGPGIVASGGVLDLALTSLPQSGGERPDLINQSVLGATGSNGTLLINDTWVMNSGLGDVAAVSSGLVELTAAQINGGAVQATSGATIKAVEDNWSTISGAKITNGGTLGADNANLLIAGGSVTNNGVLEASSVNAQIGLAQTDGLLVVSASITGSGHAVIDGTGEIEFGGSGVKENVVFANNASGILRLDHALSYGGVISGATANDRIDLVDIAYHSGTAQQASVTGYSEGTKGGVTTGTVQITYFVGSSAHVASFKFDGHHQQSDFLLADDGHGGTVLIDPPSAGAPAVAGSSRGANLALFANHIAASFVAATAGQGGGLLGNAEHAGNQPPLLTHPHPHT